MLRDICRDFLYELREYRENEPEICKQHEPCINDVLITVNTLLAELWEPPKKEIELKVIK